MTPRIIGLTGAARAGKDTVADYILEAIPAQKESFAKALKVSTAALFGVPEEHALDWADDLKRHGEVRLRMPNRWPSSLLTGREFLQRYGTEAHRDVFGDDFWVDVLLTRLVAEGGSYVITDARFANECAAIGNMGGEIWEIVRPNNPEELEGSLEKKHPSESGVPAELVDKVIINGGTLHDLQTAVWKMLANRK